MSHNADNTHHFSMTINKIPRFSLTKSIPRLSQISGNPAEA